MSYGAEKVSRFFYPDFIIDVTLAFIEHKDIVDWKVDTEYFTFSDHRLITLKLGANPPKNFGLRQIGLNLQKPFNFPNLSYPYWSKNTIETESKEINKIIHVKIKKCTGCLTIKCIK